MGGKLVERGVIAQQPIPSLQLESIVSYHVQDT